MKKPRRFAIYVLLVLFLAACSPKYEKGLDSVAASGHWMSVLQPVKDSNPQVTVIDIQTGEPHLTLPDADIYKKPITLFSPSGDYLIYHGSEFWMLVEVANKNEWKLAPLGSSLEFLPDDEILIRSHQAAASADGAQSESVYQLALVSPSSPDSKWDVITEKGRYIFRSQTQGLSGVAGASLAINTPAQAFCSPSTIVNQTTFVIVENDGLVWVFTSDRQRSGRTKLTKLSESITDLLQNHEALREALAKQQLEADTQGQEMSDEAKAAYVDLIAHSGITGVVSQDGRQLLLLTATGISTETQQYYLILIDLETSKQIPLSSGTGWAPAFLFSPDGKQVIYESNMKGDRAWYLLTLDGSDPIRLDLQGITALCWQ